MKLTAFTDYSLRVLIYLAAEPGRRATIAEIARAFAISENHLTKVVHFLGQAGFLQNLRGKGGGLRLARPAAEIVLGDVVRRTEGEPMPAECFGTTPGRCVIAPACRLHGVLARAVDAFHAVLDDVTLADIVANREALVPLLFTAPARTTTEAPRAG